MRGTTAVDVQRMRKLRFLDVPYVTSDVPITDDFTTANAVVVLVCPTAFAAAAVGSNKQNAKR